jgi:hypothetical protein
MPLRHFLTAPSIIESVPPKKSRREKDLKFRPPAVPLIAVDPYFSIWSCDDHLTDDWAKHWTGLSHGMGGLLRVDGKVYRFMGPAPQDCPALRQTGLVVFPTRTIYTFKSREIEFKVAFQTPALPENLEVFSWPISYIQFSIQSRDGKPHEAEVYLELSAEISVENDQQQVFWFRLQQTDSDVIACGCRDQRMLEKAGDNLRIDWGFLYLALPRNLAGQLVVSRHDAARNAFMKNEPFPLNDDTSFPCAVADGWPKLCAMVPLKIDGETLGTRHVVVAYDDHYSLEYHERRLRPYWRRNGKNIGDLLKAAILQHDDVTRQCEEFDRSVVHNLHLSGGAEYARLACLAYRQTTAAHKLTADFDGTLLYFSKENFSNGCMGTVDVTYPSAPFFLLFNPKLLQAQIEPIMNYARSPSWKFPFAPHDLGVYPKANGQVYGGGERSEGDQMPVEECGNLLILAAALTQAQNNTFFAEKNWDLLSKWAEYLAKKGFDPEKQLCTDDFAGRLAHNANLSIKTILALGAYAQMAKRTGRLQEARKHHTLARKMVRQWMKAADDGDHYRLTFDGPKTWSLKYNLFWDKALHLHLFPEEVVRKEMAFYKKKQKRYGLPLDSRQGYGKSDWIAWWAGLCDDPRDFRTFILPLYRWCESTSSRVPLPDWYWTQNGRQVTYYVWRSGRRIGFQARSVVGGFFAKLYMDQQMWRSTRKSNPIRAHKNGALSSSR